MNTIDLIVCIVAAWAVFNGWRRGFILQACSLAGLAAGIWLAAKWGPEAGLQLGLDPEVRALGGFVVVLLAVVLLVAVAGRIVRRIFRFAGFGLPDVLLGIAVSLAKYLLLLSVVLAAFDSLNEDWEMVDRRTIGQSKCYGPIIGLSESLVPLTQWAGERLPKCESRSGQEDADSAPQTQSR